MDHVGDTDPQALLAAARRCAAENADPAPAFAPAQVVAPRRGYLPERMISDLAG